MAHFRFSQALYLTGFVVFGLSSSLPAASLAVSGKSGDATTTKQAPAKQTGPVPLSQWLAEQKAKQDLAQANEPVEAPRPAEALKTNFRSPPSDLTPSYRTESLRELNYSLDSIRKLEAYRNRWDGTPGKMPDYQRKTVDFSKYKNTSFNHPAYETESRSERQWNFAYALISLVVFGLAFVVRVIGGIVGFFRYISPAPTPKETDPDFTNLK